MSGISSISYANNVQSVQQRKTNQSISFRASAEQEPDTYESSQPDTKPPRIGAMRLAFSYLTDDQINQINQSKKLPSNAKFVMNGMGGFTITNNFFDLRAGTQNLPEGFEVKRNLLGFAVVLPKGSHGAMLR